jgi:hypothetical protein
VDGLRAVRGAAVPAVQGAVLVPGPETGNWHCTVCLEHAREGFAEADRVERRVRHQMEETTMSTTTSLTERMRAARERRGFTEDQLHYDPLLRSMIENVARSEERAATEDELAAAFVEVGAQHGLSPHVYRERARSRGSWRGGGIRRTSATAAANRVGKKIRRIRCAEADDGDVPDLGRALSSSHAYVLQPRSPRSA